MEGKMMTKFRVCRSSGSRYGYDADDEDSMREEQEHPPVPDAVYEDELSRELWQHVWTATVGSMEEVMELSRSLGHKVILGAQKDEDTGLPTLEVYDGYRE